MNTRTLTARRLKYARTLALTCLEEVLPYRENLDQPYRARLVDAIYKLEYAAKKHGRATAQWQRMRHGGPE